MICISLFLPGTAAWLEGGLKEPIAFFYESYLLPMKKYGLPKYAIASTRLPQAIQRIRNDNITA